MSEELKPLDLDTQGIIYARLTVGNNVEIGSCKAIREGLMVSLNDKELVERYVESYQRLVGARTTSNGFIDYPMPYWVNLHPDDRKRYRIGQLRRWFSSLEKGPQRFTTALDVSTDQRHDDSAFQVPLLTPQEHRNDDMNQRKTLLEFKRETRYVVFKLSDLNKYLGSQTFPPPGSNLMRAIMGVGEIIARGRSLDGKPPFNAVVVEQDWPEFDMVWDSIEKRMIRPNPPGLAQPYAIEGLENLNRRDLIEALEKVQKMYCEAVTELNKLRDIQVLKAHVEGVPLPKIEGPWW